jgi:hypothetical protein
MELLSEMDSQSYVSNYKNLNISDLICRIYQIEIVVLSCGVWKIGTQSAEVLCDSFRKFLERAERWRDDNRSELVTIHLVSRYPVNNLFHNGTLRLLNQPNSSFKPNLNLNSNGILHPSNQLNPLN